MKGDGSTDLSVVDRFDGGVGWIAYPEETMRRASHAVRSDGELWVFDPVDADGVDDLLTEFDADVGGVVVGLDRHLRDADVVASRHDVPVYVPSWMSGVADAFDAPVERFDEGLAGFAVERLVDNPFWQEAAFFDGETLVVPEALGTVPYFRLRDERVGVHPMLRLFPPRSLRAYDAERLLVGHGEGIQSDARTEIRGAIERSRSSAPSVYVRNVRNLLGL